MFASVVACGLPLNDFDDTFGREAGAYGLANRLADLADEGPSRIGFAA